MANARKNARGKAIKTISPDELVKMVSKNHVSKYIDAIGKKVDIKLLAWADMMEMQKLPADAREDAMVSHALNISRADAKKMRLGNGMLYAPIIAAINEVYGLTEDDVKKKSK